MQEGLVEEGSNFSSSNNSPLRKQYKSTLVNTQGLTDGRTPSSSYMVLTSGS